MRATIRIQKSGVMERNFNGIQETISNFTCAHIHTDSCRGGVGGFAFVPRTNDQVKSQSQLYLSDMRQNARHAA